MIQILVKLSSHRASPATSVLHSWFFLVAIIVSTETEEASIQLDGSNLGKSSIYSAIFKMAVI